MPTQHPGVEIHTHKHTHTQIGARTCSHTQTHTRQHIENHINKLHTHTPTHIHTQSIALDMYKSTCHRHRAKQILFSNKLAMKYFL